MGSFRTILAPLAWLVCAALVCRTTEPSAADLIRAGQAELRNAAHARPGAADRALQAFDAALGLAPGSAEARAGRGLALLAQALEVPVARKLALARRGCADLDAAVAAAPDNAAVRLMRATSAMKVPLLLERSTIAESDFRILLAAARDRTSAMSAVTRRSIFYQAAAFALKERRTGAADLLEEAASISAPEPSDDELQSLLALARRPSTLSTHADSHPSEEASASRP